MRIATAVPAVVTDTDAIVTAELSKTISIFAVATADLADTPQSIAVGAASRSVVTPRLGVATA
jgi:hypothetical protein